MQGEKGQSVKIHHHLPRLFQKTEQFIFAIPFISGARTFDRSLSLKFEKSTYDSTLNVLEL